MTAEPYLHAIFTPAERALIVECAGERAEDLARELWESAGQEILTAALFWRSSCHTA